MTAILFWMGAIHAQDVRLDWVKTVGSPPYSDFSDDLAVDDSGNVYTAGAYAFTVDLDPGPEVDEFTSVWVQDIYIHKLDNEGNYKWAKSIGGTLGDRGTGITTDAEGNVYVTGYFELDADFDPNEDELILSSEGQSDAFILKLDSLGNMLWAKSIGGTTLDRGLGIAVDEAGNVYGTGFFTGTVDFDPGLGTFEQTAGGEYDIYVIKLDDDGNFLWANNYGDTGFDVGTEIVLDDVGNVCITGYFDSTVDFNPDGIAAEHTSAGGADCFVLKLDTDGNYLWSKSFGGVFGTDLANSLTLDSGNNVYVVGRFAGTVDFNPGFGDSTVTHVGGNDGYILKLDDTGEFEWVRTISGEYDIRVNKIVVGDENDVFAAGIFTRIADFDPGVGVYEVDAGIFDEDTYLLKLNSLGEFVWVRHYDSEERSSPQGLDLDDSANIFMSGRYEGVIDFDPGADTLESNTTDDFWDFFILKMAPCSPHETTDNIEACGSYTWIDGIEYFESTTEPIYVLADTSGCDSLIHLNLTILPIYENTDSIVACDSYTWIDGVEYVDDTLGATFLYETALGCDSLVILNLTIFESSESIDEITACDSLTWTDGITYYADNFTATDTFINAVGCDSIVTLNLTVNYSSEGIDTQTACDSFTWIDGETYTEDNTSAIHILTNATSCDSIVTLSLTVNYSNEGTATHSACNSFVWIDGVEYFEDNNTATYAHTNAAGCDSIITLNLAVHELDLTITNEDPTLTVAEPEAEYQWLDCLNDFEPISGANTISFTPEENGEYAVEVTKYGCSDTSDCISVSTVDLEEELPTKRVTLFPNPTSGNVTIELGGLANATIRLFTPGGQLVSNYNSQKPLVEVIMPEEKGIYLIEISSETQIDYFRVIRL